jgi:hypothetical protein
MLFNRDIRDKGDKTEKHKDLFGLKPRIVTLIFAVIPFILFIPVK